MNKTKFIIKTNERIALDVYEMKLEGDTSEIKAGQFVNIELDGLYLRRPISVCYSEDNELTIVYKVVGVGTEQMSTYTLGKELDILTQLGNGYDESVAGNHPLLIGGGVGVPPMYKLASNLISAGKQVTVILGFNKAEEIFYKDKFVDLGCDVIITTVDGSVGIKGFVTDAMKEINYTYFYACGPLPMLKAVYNSSNTSGQFSLEERMGCGFGACMGCSCKTHLGNKRICKDGPVFTKEEIIF